MSDVLEALLTRPRLLRGVLRDARLATMLVNWRHKARPWQDPLSTLKIRLGLRSRLPLLTRYLTETTWPGDVAAALESLPPRLMADDTLEPDAAHWVFSYVLHARPQTPVLVGSGMATVVAALALNRLSDALGGPRLTVLESDPRARESTREALAHTGLDDRVLFETPEQASPPGWPIPPGIDLLLAPKSELSEEVLESLSVQMRAGGVVLCLGAIEVTTPNGASLELTGYVPKGRGITVMTKPSPPPAA